MSEKDALAVLVGKVRCEDCYWLTKNASEDFIRIPRIKKEADEGKLTLTPERLLKLCFKRVGLDKGSFPLERDKKLPPVEPRSDIWRYCEWFIGFKTVIQCGGGVAFGIFKE
jgi:hypothetical protein